MAGSPGLGRKKTSVSRFRWNVALLGAVLLKSVVKCQDAATCVDIGDTAALSCGLNLGGLTISLLQWRKVGLTPNDLVAGYLSGTATEGPAYTGRATINDTGFLLLTNVQEADEGIYRCTAITLSDFSNPPDLENFLGKTGAPTNIGCTTSDTIVNSTTSATLTCTADPGCPPAQPSWTQVPTTDQVNNTNGILIISNVTKHHRGTYGCAVSNTHGNGQCQINLIVQYPPEITSGTGQSITVDKLEGSVRLTVSVNAFPAAEIIWKKEGSQEELKRSADMFHDVSSDQSNAGKYTCTAENMLGSTSCGEFDVAVTVWKLVLVIVIPLLAVIAVIVAVAVVMCKKPNDSKVLPKAPAGIKLQPVPSSHKVEIQWTAESKGSYAIQHRPRGSDVWTNVDVSADSHPYYKHTVDFQQDGNYEVCVHVRNVKGEMKSDIKEVTVKASSHPGEADSPVSPLHGNNTSKSDVVFVIREGQSHPPIKLEPLEIKQKPAEKKSKKKKKRKKMNEVHASDEDLKPPED